MKQNSRSALLFNVGFLLHQDVGISRNFDFDEPTVQIADDLDVTDFRGTLSLTRTAQGLYAQGRMNATINLDCVRCLTSFPYELTVELTDLFVHPPNQATDPLLVIAVTGELDLSGILREYMLLDIPTQPICVSDCQGLCAVCGGRLADDCCEHPELEVDPRLAVLRSLLPDS
ncbi:MAG: hypothetical protein GTO18_07060 [Anaerolineales bacterium]|nr:hypothetical protein [Anaerolineales bacterium]